MARFLCFTQLITSLLCCGCLAAVAQTIGGEYEVKIAYLYNLARLVEWPQPASSSGSRDDFQLCLLDSHPFGDLTGLLEGRPVHGKPLRVRVLGASEPLQKCHIVFVGTVEAAREEAVLRVVAQRPVLTVSETTGFAQRGGMVGLTLTAEGTVGIVVNRRAVTRAGLVMSSRILKLATIVE